MVWDRPAKSKNQRVSKCKWIPLKLRHVKAQIRVPALLHGYHSPFYLYTGVKMNFMHGMTYFSRWHIRVVVVITWVSPPLRGGTYRLCRIRR